MKCVLRFVAEVVRHEFMTGRLECANHRHLRACPVAAARRSAPRGSGMGELGICQGLSFVTEQQDDVTGLGLRTTQLKAPRNALDFACGLTALQRVPQSA